MRKLLTFGIASALIVFATSCTEDEETSPLGPSLSVTESGTASTGGDITIEQGEALTFTWDARKGDRDLETFAITLTGVNVVNPIPMSTNGETFPYDISNADDETYVDGITFNSAGGNTGLTTYEFTVTDAAGASTTVRYDVTVEAAVTTTDLSAAQNFTWMRVGGNPGTGLDQFGLMWISNSSTSAVVAVDGNTVMVSLPSSTWTSIDTEEELADAIDDGTQITTYTGVSVSANSTYSDVLGVRHDNVDYILQIQTGTVTTGGSGTTVTINGQYKN